MPAHATKTSYITSYMKIEVFDRAEKDLIVFGKMNGGSDIGGSRYCLRAYVNAMCWSASSEGLTMENWTGVGDFISTLDPSYCVYPILFFRSPFFFILLSFFSRIRIDGSSLLVARPTIPLHVPPPFCLPRHSRHLLHHHHHQKSYPQLSQLFDPPGILRVSHD